MSKSSIRDYILKNYSVFSVINDEKYLSGLATLISNYFLEEYPDVVSLNDQAKQIIDKLVIEEISKINDYEVVLYQNIEGIIKVALQKKWSNKDNSLFMKCFNNILKYFFAKNKYNLEKIYQEIMLLDDKELNSIIDENINIINDEVEKGISFNTFKSTGGLSDREVIIKNERYNYFCKYVDDYIESIKNKELAKKVKFYKDDLILFLMNHFEEEYNDYTVSDLRNYSKEFEPIIMNYIGMWQFSASSKGWFNVEKLEKIYRKKKKISTTSIAIATATFLSIQAILISIGINWNDRKYEENVGFDFPKITGKVENVGNNYLPTMMNVIRIYNDLYDYDNPEYKYIQFYRAYESIEIHGFLADKETKENYRLHLLERMFWNMNSQAKGMQAIAFFDDIGRYDSFLEFVMDRIDITPEQREKYEPVVQKYTELVTKKLQFGAYEKLKSEEQTIIKEILEIYCDQSKKLESSFNRDIRRSERGRTY